MKHKTLPKLDPRTMAVLAGRCQLWDDGDATTAIEAPPPPPGRVSRDARLMIRANIDPRLGVLVARTRAGIANDDDTRRLGRAAAVAAKIGDGVFFQQVATAIEDCGRYGLRRWATYHAWAALGREAAPLAAIQRRVKEMIGVELPIQVIRNELLAMGLHGAPGRNR